MANTSRAKRPMAKQKNKKILSTPTARSTKLKETANTTFDSPTAFSVKFKSINQVFKEVTLLHNRGCINLHVYDVTPKIVRSLNDEREKRWRKWRLNHYLPEHQLLIITAPNAPHETLGLTIQTEVHLLVRSMGLQHKWKSIGATTYPASMQNIEETGIGEGDGGGKPRTHRMKLTDFPTLVIEADCSQSLACLRKKMRWWFCTSNHDVKIVLLAHTNLVSKQGDTNSHEPRRKIIIEKWIETEKRPLRAGATTTRAITQGSRLSPEQVHESVITYNKRAQNPPRAEDIRSESFTISKSSMILEFPLLFLQEPRQHEHDIVLDRDFWSRYGCEVLEDFL